MDDLFAIIAYEINSKISLQEAKTIVEELANDATANPGHYSKICYILNLKT